MGHIRQSVLQLYAYSGFIHALVTERVRLLAETRISHEDVILATALSSQCPTYNIGLLYHSH